MHRRTAQAAGLSVGLHAAVLAAVLLLNPRAAEGPGQLTIIQAELLFDRGTSTSLGAKVDGPGQGPEVQRDAPAAESTEPAQPTAPLAADAPVADEPEPPADEADTVTEIEQLAAGAEPEPVETLAEVPSGAPAAVADAEPSPTPAEAAEGTAAAAEAGAAAETVADESADSGAPAAEAVAANASETAPGTSGAALPGVPLQSRERKAIEKRFASWTGTFQPTASDPTVAWKQDGYAYTAVLRKLPSVDPMGIERVIVDVSTEQGGRRMATQLTMTRLAFSNFAQFVDQWDPNVQIHDDEIDGRFHSNTEIKLLSSRGTAPVFNGRVTIASREIGTETSGRFSRREVFPEGLEMGVRRIALPSRFLPFLNEAANGTEAVQRFERSTRIIFYSDGTYGWSYLDRDEPEQRRPVREPAHYLIGLEDAALHIKGTVNGKVLVYTAERIVIEDDLRYAHGRNERDGDDYLGLVAERSVEIAEPEVTGPGDLEIDASIYARRRFAVRDFHARESGTLRIFGSMTAGSVTATEPRFATKVEFDRRLENARPPSFPLTDRYELESWDGEWREERVLD